MLFVSDVHPVASPEFSLSRQCNVTTNIDWKGVKILDKESVDIKRKIKEAIHIRRQRPTLNRDGGYDLPTSFDHLLSRD